MSIEREVLHDFSCFWAKMISTNMQTTFTQTRWRANKICTCAPTVGCFGFFLRDIVWSAVLKLGKKVIVRSPNQAKRAESSIQLGVLGRFGRLRFKFAQASLEVWNMPCILFWPGVGIPVIHVFFLSYSFLEKQSHLYINYQYIYI